MFFTNKDTFILSTPGCLHSEMDSLESIMDGNAAGATGCVIDLDMTTDGLAVLSRSHGFRRHDGSFVSLDEGTYDEIRHEFGKVITVGQAIELAKSCAAKLCINLVDMRAAFPAKLALMHADYMDSSYFIGMNLEQAVNLHRVQPALNLMPTLLKPIPEYEMEEFVGKLKDAGMYGLHAAPELLTRSMVEVAHRVGLFISSAPTSDDDRLAELIDWQVNFILTDRPDLAAAHMPVPEIEEPQIPF